MSSHGSALAKVKERKARLAQRRKNRKAQREGGGGGESDDTPGPLIGADDEYGERRLEDMVTPIKQEGQVWALLSHVGPSDRQACDRIAIQIHGAFGTHAEAMSAGKALREVYPRFDTHAVRMYRWLPIPTMEEDIALHGMEYEQAELGKIMKNYGDAAIRGKKEVEERLESARLDASRKAAEAKGRNP